MLNKWLSPHLDSRVFVESDGFLLVAKRLTLKDQSVEEQALHAKFLTNSEYVVSHITGITLTSSERPVAMRFPGWINESKCYHPVTQIDSQKLGTIIFKWYLKNFGIYIPRSNDPISKAVHNLSALAQHLDPSIYPQADMFKISLD